MLFVTKNKDTENNFGIFHSVSVSVSVRVKYRRFGIGTKKVPPVGLVPNTEIPKMHSVSTALLPINESKSCVMDIVTKSSLSLSVVCYNDSIFTPVTDVKLLGVIFHPT